MTANERIELCKMLAIELLEQSPTEGSEELMGNLMAFNDYVNSDEFEKMNGHSKMLESFDLMCDMIKSMAKHIDTMNTMIFGNGDPREMSLEEAKKELYDQYMKAMGTGDDSIASMSINDWMLSNSVMIVQPKAKKPAKRKKKKSEVK